MAGSRVEAIRREGIPYAVAMGKWTEVALGAATFTILDPKVFKGDLCFVQFESADSGCAVSEAICTTPGQILVTLTGSSSGDAVAIYVCYRRS